MKFITGFNRVVQDVIASANIGRKNSIAAYTVSGVDADWTVLTWRVVYNILHTEIEYKNCRI